MNRKGPSVSHGERGLRRAGSGANVVSRSTENFLLGKNMQACVPLDQVHDKRGDNVEK